MTPTPAVVAPEPEPIPEPEPQVEPAPVNDITLGFTAQQTDSLLAVWHERLRSDSFADFFDRYIGIDSLIEHAGNTVPDSLYAGRLRALVSPIPLAYNTVVKDRINLYVNKQREMTARILGTSHNTTSRSSRRNCSKPICRSNCAPCRSSNRPSSPPPPRVWEPSGCGSSCPRRPKATDWKSIRWSTNAATPSARRRPPCAICATSTTSTAIGRWPSPPTTAGRAM